LMVTCILTARTIFATRATVEATLREKAGESNQLAAMFAARTLELELRKYFELVQREAGDSAIRQNLAALLNNEQFSVFRDAIREREGAAEARREMMQAGHHERLEQLLQDRLNQYDGQNAGTGSIDLATMFITDSSGTIVAIAYDAPVAAEEDSVGRNFAFRAYFHGGRDDFDQSTDPRQVEPLRETHLSPAFFSTATLTWKVAVSVPIYLRADHSPNAPPDAVFVATTNLGGFDLMRSDREQSMRLNQVAVLVDTRAGNKRGTIIQHPLLNQVVKVPGLEGLHTRTESPRKAPAVDPGTLDALLAGRDVDYRDPMGNEPGGEEYQGVWVAAVQPVTLPAIEPTARERKTDMLVLVEYRWSDVIAPVGQLVNQILIYGAVAVCGILVVIFLLWAFVRRVGDESAPAGPLGEPHRSGTTETIPAS